jgi:carbon monoxide dehydrogenase subunit G
MRFEGERRFAQPVEELWPKFSDAAFLARSVPGATLRGEPTHDRAQYCVQPGFSFARSSMDVTMEIVERHEPDLVRFRLISKGVGTSNTVDTVLTLTPDGTGTRAQWIAQITQLGGLLKLVPSGLIKGAAQQVIDDVWNGIGKALSSPLAG